MIEKRHVEGKESFAALVAAATAIEQHRPPDLASALETASSESVLRVAARHRCLGYLRRGILELGVGGRRPRAITEALRDYASRAAIQAYAVRSQLSRLVQTLSEARVQFVLLKGAARLFRGDKEADCETMYDLDVLVSRESAASAADALLRAGYRWSVGESLAARYRERHHHLAPLQPLELGLPVELHVELAPPGSLSIMTDWNACEIFVERVTRESVTATCLNSLGSALNLAIHGLGVHRLYDIILLAKMFRSDPTLYGSATAIISQERWQGVALQAATALGAQIAGLDVRPSESVVLYLKWVIQREVLAPYVRERAQFADAWYCNGCSIWGPATRYALPSCDLDKSQIAFAATFIWRLLGRIATGAYALTFTTVKAVYS